MPWQEDVWSVLKAQDVRRILGTVYTLEPLGRAGVAAGPARVWRIRENGVRVGFISPLSEHFCATCNRLRLQCDGHLRTCLAHDDTPSLRDLLREGATDAALAEAIRSMVLGKPAGHNAELDGGTPFAGVMTGIGG